MVESKTKLNQEGLISIPSLISSPNFESLLILMFDFETKVDF
jgi:hypothetical protein